MNYAFKMMAVVLALGVVVFGSAGISYAEQLFCKKVSCKFYGRHPSAVYGKNETTCSYLKKEMYFNYSYIKKQNYKWYDSKNYVNCSIGELCEGSNSRSTYQLNNKVLNITTNGFISEMYGDFNMQSQYNCKIVGQNQNPKIANKSQKNKSTISSQSWSLPDCPSTYLFNNCYGSFTWVSGNKYVGEWKDNKPNGQGTLTFSNGNKYVGEFKDNKANGQGTKTWADGDKYIGEWKDYLRNGQGTHTWVNGNKYVGEWKDDNQNGQGTFAWKKSGNKYIGEWKDGNQNGQGTFTWANGDKYEGEWKDDNKNGQGTFAWKKSGNKYIGEWKDGNRTGEGIVFFSNGKVEEGIFKDNKFMYAQKIKKIDLNTINSEHLFEGKKCKTTKSDFNQIRDNCIISKLEPNANSSLRHAVRNSCSRIACNPSFIEKFRFK